MEKSPPKKEGKFHIGKVVETKVPETEAQKERLDKFIERSRELQSIAEVIKSPNFKIENIGQMVDHWNENHREWAGFYVEREFGGVGGLVLKVRMDRAGNVQLGY